MKTANRGLILVACIVINLCLGLGYAWSVFQAPLMELFNWTTAEASLAFSISFAVVPLAMIVNGPRQDREGPKRITFVGGILFGLGMILTGFISSLPMLYITYGVLVGAGIGACYGCTTNTAVKWFPDKKGLAGGLSAAGFGSGAIVFAPLASNLINNFGVLRTFQILGVATLLIICGLSLLMSHPEKKNVVVGSETDKAPNQMLKETSFWHLWLIYVIGCLGGLMIIGHASPIALEHIKFDKETATLIVSVVAIANTSGRLVWGAVSDKIGRYNTAMVMFITSAAGLFLLQANLNQLLSVVGIFAVALCFGGFLGTFPGITADNWGVKFSGTNYGIMFTAFGIASLAGPQLAAWIKESSGGNYSGAFMISMGLSLLGVLLMFLFIQLRKRRTKLA